MEANRQPSVVDLRRRAVRPARSRRTALLVESSTTPVLAFTTTILAATMTLCGCAAFAATPADFEAGDPNVETFLPGDFRFQTFKQWTSEFLDPSAFETRQMHVIHIGLCFIEMFFAVQVHQIEFINQPHLLEKINRSVHGCPIDLPVTLLRQRQQRCGVQMAICFLNGFQQYPSLAGDPDATQRQFLE
jgi:hypothetical protein